MLDYNTCRRLKDAGFPQPKIHNEKCSCHESWHYYLDDDDMVYSACEITPDLDESWYYIPTLSELIEECGKGFKGLTKIDVGKIKWHCYGYKGDAIKANLIEIVGAILEKTVANLWLARNEKKV